ncbi:MAG: T9SS type A sorting domain-containing protein, partial [Bacteroidales bacterium]|nr:T9SS type A sorting domain-containing protein [Bacteroidales bacterium]
HAFTSAGAHTIELKIINEGGCTYKTEKSIEVFQTPEAPVVTIDGATEFCLGDSVSLTAPTGFNSYLWSSGNNEEDIMIKTSGNYAVIVTDENNCKASSATTTINVHELPLISFVESNDFCKYESLDAGAGHSGYLWNDGSVEQTLEILEAGTYHVTVTDEFGCENYKESVVTIKDAPYVNLGADTVICEGESLQLNAGSEAVSYLWSNYSSGQTITVSAEGTYSVTVTGENGCTNNDEIVVTVNPFPDITSVDKVYPTTCSSIDASFTINSSQGLQFSIDGGENFQTTSTFSGLSAGNYLVQIRGDNICPSEELVNLLPEGFSLNKPDIQDLELCYGESGTFIATDGNTEWYNSTLEYLATSATYTPAEIEVGMYTYYAAIVDGNCKSELDEISFQINELPVAYFAEGDIVEKCQHDTIIVMFQTLATTIEWVPATGLSSSDISNPEVFVTENTTYLATAISDKGCTNSDEITVNVLPAPDQPLIIGKSTACLNEHIIYSATYDKSAILNWEIAGGVLSEINSDSIEVHWDNLYSTGSLSVYLINPKNTCKSLYETMSLTSSGKAADKMDVYLKGDYLLYVLPDGKCQWYYDNKALAGKTEKWLQADVIRAEDYFCLVTTDEVCQTISNPYSFEQSKGYTNKLISVNPNPVREKFFINIAESILDKKARFSITSLTGKLLLFVNLDSPSTEKWVDVSNLKDGTYIWKYETKNFISTGRLVKSN